MQKSKLEQKRLKKIFDAIDNYKKYHLCDNNMNYFWINLSKKQMQSRTTPLIANERPPEEFIYY